MTAISGRRIDLAEALKLPSPFSRCTGVEDRASDMKNLRPIEVKKDKTSIIVPRPSEGGTE